MKPDAIRPLFPGSSCCCCAAEAAAKEAGWNSWSRILADGTYGQSSLNAITGKAGGLVALSAAGFARASTRQHWFPADRLAAGACGEMRSSIIRQTRHRLRAEQDALLLEVWQACNKSDTSCCWK